jgi:NTE family protein
MDKQLSKKPLGLCLSGGGAIGIAHIGVLQALLENGIEPDMISGSSMGAIVGALYAGGYSPAEMMQIIKDDRLYMVSKLMTFQPKFWKSGFSTHSTVHKLLEDAIPHDRFDKLKRPLHLCVTNLSTMEWEIKSEGEHLADWVSASASIPGVFEALTLNGFVYIDGGVLNNLPAQPLKPLCRAIIGVDVLPFIPISKTNRPIDVITSAVRGIQKVNSAEGRSLCNHIIDAQAVKRYNEFRFDAYQKIYESGHKDGLEYIKKHPEILSL